VGPCGAFDGLDMLQQNKGCSTLCGPVAQLGARFHGMEEVIGSIPIRSTNQTPVESKSYSNRSKERTEKQGHKKGTTKNTIVRDPRKKSNAHWNDQWAFLHLPYLFSRLARPRTGPKHASELPACPPHRSDCKRPEWSGCRRGASVPAPPYPFALLDQERCKRMPEGMPDDRLCDPRPDCSRRKLSLQRGVEP
jgi:hypothetical protein